MNQPHATFQKIPKGYYSYYAAILATETLIDKISDCCQKPPVIAGALSERKAAVQKIEIECIPELYQVSPSEKGGQNSELFPETRNRVLEKLLPRYTDIIPRGKDHTVTQVALKYMSIPTVIRFKNPP